MAGGSYDYLFKVRSTGYHLLVAAAGSELHPLWQLVVIGGSGVGKSCVFYF
jgi:hypothetical protein